jgi:hypothetical protein
MNRASALFRSLLQQPDHFLVQLRWNAGGIEFRKLAEEGAGLINVDPRLFVPITLRNAEEALSSGSWLKKELGSSMSIRVSSSPSR